MVGLCPHHMEHYNYDVTDSTGNAMETAWLTIKLSTITFKFNTETANLIPLLSFQLLLSPRYERGKLTRTMGM